MAKAEDLYEGALVRYISADKKKNPIGVVESWHPLNMQVDFWGDGLMWYRPESLDLVPFQDRCEHFLTKVTLHPDFPYRNATFSMRDHNLFFQFFRMDPATGQYVLQHSMSEDIPERVTETEFHRLCAVHVSRVFAHEALELVLVNGERLYDPHWAKKFTFAKKEITLTSHQWNTLPLLRVGQDPILEGDEWLVRPHDRKEGWIHGCRVGNEAVLTPVRLPGTGER